MTEKYQSPYADLNTSNRFKLANQLALTYRLDVGQVLFTYLKVAEPILKKSGSKKISLATQREIDTLFTSTLKQLSPVKE